MIDRLAINAKITPGQTGSAAAAATNEGYSKMVVIAAGSTVIMWGVKDEGTRTDIGKFTLPVPIEFLFFIGTQLVALSQMGKIGVWHSMTQHVLVQDIVPIMSFDTAGSFLLLGCTSGAISYIGMILIIRIRVNVFTSYCSLLHNSSQSLIIVLRYAEIPTSDERQ